MSMHEKQQMKKGAKLQNKKRDIRLEVEYLVSLSGQRDSNTRPPGPKPGTLPTALYPEYYFT